MRKLLIAVSFLGLLLTVVPSFLVYHEVIDFTNHKTLALIGTLLWLGTAPFWMNKQQNSNV
ncbi:MAG: hypothetical protein WBA23_23405 [Tunicatimonas sp.]|uniref:hypothetical protein n=1 Tax=Tunicatimonas sp. TaxID=1940096 RepID=UPI003C77A1C8